MKYYINIFFINSILGFILETIINHNNSGILFGPWTPVYGIGSIIITIIFIFLNKKIKNNILKFIIFFISISIILSIIEMIGGILIEKIFGITFWNYENHKFNIGKYASIEMSLIWGLASFIYILFLKKLIDKIEVKIPKIITYILTILFIIDNIITLIIK